MDLDVEMLIQTFGLQRLPVEGGLYRQTYRSLEVIPSEALPGRYQGQGEEGASPKPFSTAILYLLTSQLADRHPAGSPDSFSALHRLPTDEIYHFYLGDPLEMTLLYPDGSSRQVILGQDVFAGQQVQFVAPRGVWQGTRLVSGGRYALVGTTMAPGYTDSDYEPGDRALLLSQYPQESERILALTR